MIKDLSDMPTLKATLAGPEEDQWVQAICSKLDNIKSKYVYDLVNPRSENIENLLGNKIVLHHKHGPTGRVKCYKAQFTAQGDHQCESIEFDETFAPVVKSASLWVFFALCAKLSFKTWHMDVTSAFLNGILNEIVYMHQPKGFEVPGKEGWVWKLKKALYSLKQGGHEWYHCINEFLTKTLGLM